MCVFTFSRNETTSFPVYNFWVYAIIKVLQFRQAVLIFSIASERYVLNLNQKNMFFKSVTVESLLKVRQGRTNNNFEKKNPNMILIT